MVDVLLLWKRLSCNVNDDARALIELFSGASEMSPDDDSVLLPNATFVIFKLKLCRGLGTGGVLELTDAGEDETLSVLLISPLVTRCCLFLS